MEPDPMKNVEKRGFSKRRLSSILKAPRKSAKFPDPEQQENVVECAKPGEKRNSRRVSFAPANDVLLFSKDAKNTSPARSPFQELTATTACPTLNRSLTGVSGDGSQKIAGMESLLNAPLHDYQQNNKVICDTRDDFGERTVMFSAHEASLDMTQSHSINITADADILDDISFQTNDVLPSALDKKVIFPISSLSADKTHSHCASVAGGSTSLFSGRKQDLCVEKKNGSASLPFLDPEFEDFLVSLAKPAGPSVGATIARVTPPQGPSSEDKNRPLTQTNRVYADKENHTPASVPAATGKSLHNASKTGQFSAALCPEDDVTEAQRGDDDVDPFQWLFPSQDMFANSDRRVSQTSENVKTNQQQSRKSVGLSDPAAKSLKNTPHSHHKIIADSKEEYREKTGLLVANDPFVDQTKSHTVHTAIGSVAPELMSADAFNPGFKNVPVSHSSDPASVPVTARATPTVAPSFNEAVNTNRSFSLPKTQRAYVDKENEPLNQIKSFGRSFSGNAVCSKDASMNMAEPQERSILGGDVSMNITETQMDSSLPDTAAPLQHAFPTRATHSKNGDMKDAVMTPYQQSRQTAAPPDCKGMEIPYKTPLKTMMGIQQVKCDADFDCKDKTVRFTADDACMESTQSHTVNIQSLAHLQWHQSKNFLPAYGEKTVRFNTDDAAMDVTKSHTVNIAIDIEQNSQDMEFLPASGEKTVRFTEDDAAMDITKSHTANIASIYNMQSHQKVEFDSKNGEELMRLGHEQAAICEARNRLVDVATDFKRKSQSVDHLQNIGEKTVRFDAAMDITKSHTANIASVYNMQSHQNAESDSTNGEESVKLTNEQDGMCEARCETVGIPTDFKRKLQRVDHLQNSGEKTVRFDAAMDITKSHTANIAAVYDMQSHQNMEFDSANGDQSGRLSNDQAAIGAARSRNVDVPADFQRKSQHVDHLYNNGEKTARFDAAMDITKSLTVNIAADGNWLPHQNVDFVSTSVGLTVDATVDRTRGHIGDVDPDLTKKSQHVALLHNSGEKTVRFDAAMDTTKSHTVNIAADYSWHQNVDLETSTKEEKPVTLITNDAPKNERRNRIVDIATDFKRKSQNVDLLCNSGEKTVRFTADDAAMDVTKSHTVNIASGFQQQLQNVDTLPVFKEKTARFSSSDSIPLQQHVLPIHKNLDIPGTVTKDDSDTSVNEDRKSVCVSVGESSKAEATDLPFTQDRSGSLFQSQMEKPDVKAELQLPALCSGVTEKSVNEILTDCHDISANMDLTEAQTGCIMERTFTNETRQSISLTQNKDFEHSVTIETSAISSEAPGPSCPDNVAITDLPGSPNSSEKEFSRESEQSSRTCPIIQNTGSSPSAVSQHADVANSRNSRRRSLADLTSKVRCLNHMIQTAPDAGAADGCVMPLSSHDLDKNPEDKLTSATVEPELKGAQPEDIAQDQCLSTTEQVSASTATTDFSLMTKQLMSRLSVGGFKPKLPQRNKADDSNKGKLAEEHPRAVKANGSNHLSNFDNDVSDIFDEELGSYEDMSETLDVNEDIQKPSQRRSSFEEIEFRKIPLVDDVFPDDVMSEVHRQKRPFPVNEDMMDNEKRMKTSTDPTDMALDSVVDCDSNVFTAPTSATQTTESSMSSNTANIRCEATFESTCKQSLCESQYEDYAGDMQTKLEDGSITVLEFFKLFNIDFVIHNPRQSVCPGRLLPENEVTAMDLLKNRHISHPKQMVYEADVRNLTGQVERLKVRMEDLDKPLKAVNKPLWEEMRYYTDKELKSFGVKLKERNNFFRKTSKVQSHEMKEALYSKILQALLEEQQKLKGTIEKADEMLRSLDDCIRELQTELAGVEENGFDSKPSIKSLQEETKRASETMEDNERQISELELQKKQNSSKLKRLNAEIQNLDSHMDTLDILNEWKLKERRHNCTVYTFLHETMNLQLTYEQSDGNLADNESERKITQIHFNFELNDEKSQCHARLVHQLVSQFVEAESAWVEKFPTRSHVPKLLHDVSLVVSRCRLLGEECQRLKLWGSLPFDILHISCSGTRISIVFSSLKKCSKFEVVFGVSLSNRLCVLQVESFRNMIGSTTMEQIVQIATSFTPAKNLLTTIVKKIHETLLC